MNGTNFDSSAAVLWGTTSLATTFISTTQVTASVPASLIATAGTSNVTVVTTAGTSGLAGFTVNSSSLTITSLRPNSAPLGGADFTLTVNGTNFVSGATVLWGTTSLTTTFVSATQVIANVPASLIVSAGTTNVTVSAGSGTSNAVTFTVIIPPNISSISPATATAGVSVTISGSGFGTSQGSGTVWLGSTYATVVSWSDTQVVATVAANSTSGTARVRQNGTWSNSVTLTVNTAMISNVAPASGAPGTQVTITGSGFGAAQGTGQVWLGTANGVVQSWSDTQVVAQVAAGSASGNAQVLQNGVWSNAVPFTVNTLTITSVSPASGGAGTSITIAGTGFGASQGSGTVQLGSTAGQVVSWSDTQVVATVAATALTGIARIQQNGASSNAIAFTVPAAGGNITLVPSLLNLVVGDTHTVQAVNASGQPVTGLTWTSSDPTVVSLSTDNPPVLTALAAGHVTVTAGSASADVTVSATTLSLGTVIWSNPGDGSGVNSIVPAVPSPTGVADVFAFQDDGTVAAITSDGTTAWTADVSQANSTLPDFQGGLVMQRFYPSIGKYSIVKLDGMTGQTAATYTPSGMSWPQEIAVHTDGTIFATQENDDSAGRPIPTTVVGIDPTTGTQKFSVQIGPSTEPQLTEVYGLMVAGDGYAYIPYAYRDNWVSGQPSNQDIHLRLLRVNSSGASDDIQIFDWATTISDVIPITGPYMITNADTGIVLTWSAVTGPQMAVTTGTSVSVVNGPMTPGQQAVTPVLQLQDGSFVGSAGDMVAFDATGNVRWTVPGYQPQIATADGGVIATDPNTGSAVTFDQNGNATGQLCSLPTYSWPGYVYQSSGVLAQIRRPMIDFGLSFAQFQGGSPSNSRTYIRLFQAKIFIPAEIGDIDHGKQPETATAVANFNKDYLKSEWGSTIMNVEAFAFRRATKALFEDALKRTNLFVAYIGHGFSDPNDPVVLSDLNTFHASALGFACSPLSSENPACSQFIPMGQAGDPPILAKPKVIFLGACGIDDTNRASWILQSLTPNQGQSLVSPAPYPTPKQPIGPPNNLYHLINLLSAELDLHLLLNQYIPVTSVNPDTALTVKDALHIVNALDEPQYSWDVTKGANGAIFAVPQ